MRTGAVAARLTAALCAAVAWLSGCSALGTRSADRPQAKELIGRYGCGACHAIPGVADAVGRVGPPLEGVGRRSHVAGRLANTPENLVRWIRFPQQVDPRTVMPNLGVTDEEAREIASYLYGLR